MSCEDELARTGDPAPYAADYAGFARAFAESTFRSQLLERSPSGTREAGDLTDEFFRRLQDLLRLSSAVIPSSIRL
jgi:hypothetical protein